MGHPGLDRFVTPLDRAGLQLLFISIILCRGYGPKCFCPAVIGISITHVSASSGPNHSDSCFRNIMIEYSEDIHCVGYS